MMPRFCRNSIVLVFMTRQNCPALKPCNRRNWFYGIPRCAGRDFLYLLEDVFHMLWQKQTGKLRTLYAMASRHHQPQDFPERIFDQTPILASYFNLGGRQYQAVDDLLRLTRRLGSKNCWPVIRFLWSITLNGVSIWSVMLKSWTRSSRWIRNWTCISRWKIRFLAALAYIKEELADYYNIQLNIYPLSYRGRDEFDWSLATRLSKRTDVEFTPFCRPTEQAIAPMAQYTGKLEKTLADYWKKKFQKSDFINMIVEFINKSVSAIKNDPNFGAKTTVSSDVWKY